MKAYETTNQLGFSAVVVVGVAVVVLVVLVVVVVVVVVVLLDQNFSDEAAAVIFSVENQRVDCVCSVAVGRCSMTMIGDDWPMLAQDYGFLVYKLMLILIMWLGLNIAGPFNW